MPKVLYADQYFAVEENSEGYGYLRSGDEVLVVPMLEDGRLVLTVEPSPAFGELTLILPGGEVEEGETHANTANRELQEEVGLRANRLDFLGELRPWSKYLRVRTYVLLGRELVPSRLAADEGYEIQTLYMRIDETLESVRAGKLRDSRVIAAIALAREVLLSESHRRTGGEESDA